MWKGCVAHSQHSAVSLARDMSAWLDFLSTGICECVQALHVILRVRVNGERLQPGRVWLDHACSCPVPLYHNISNIFPLYTLFCNLPCYSSKVSLITVTWVWFFSSVPVIYWGVAASQHAQYKDTQTTKRNLTILTLLFTTVLWKNLSSDDLLYTFFFEQLLFDCVSTIINDDMLSWC